MKLIPRFLALATLLPAGAVFAQCADISLAPTTLSNATQGSPYSAAFKPGGGLPGTWSAANLPPGLGLSTAGSFNGTPATAGDFPLRLIFTGSNGCIAGLFLPLTVEPTTGPVPAITIARAAAAEPTPVPLVGTMNITDSDAGAATFTATIGVSQGTLNAAAGTNTVTVTNSGSALVTLSGTLPEINALLAGSNGGNVEFVSGGARFRDVLLTLTANDGSQSGSASAIMSGATVVAPRVWVLAPNATRQLAVSTLDALGNAIDGSPYSYASSNTSHVNVSGSGLLSSGATLNFAELTTGSSGRRPAQTWVAVNNITAVNVGSSVPSSIAASDGFSAFGSNAFLPSTSYYSDVFTISLSAGQSVVFKADSGNDLDTYMILADADGYVLAVNDDDDTSVLGVGSRINFTAPAAGTYVIEQSTFNGLDTGSYTFIVEAGLPPRPGSATTATPLREQQRVKRP